MTDFLAAFLVGQGIPAVMFFQGAHIDPHRDAGLRAVEAGFTIGNHGWSHRAFSSLTLDEAAEEIDSTERLIEGLYQEAGRPRGLRLFRFPYGDQGGAQAPAFARLLADRGFVRLNTSFVTYPWWDPSGLGSSAGLAWTFDTRDYELSDPAWTTTWDEIATHLSNPAPTQGGCLVSGTSGEIVLLHDHPQTNAVVPGYYRALVTRIRTFGVDFLAPQP